ncbi:MAG: phosphogluconate dehydrogenase (NAD(+)-dependent, decarboxylating), partial [Chloroflexota bacterium]
MKLAMVGLGKMGANMSRRLIKDGHEVVVSDINPDAVADLADEGGIASTSVADAISQLPSPKIVWVMVPAGKITESVVNSVAAELSPGDIVIDGGNSNYKETQRRGDTLADKGIYMLDCGTSGGVWGLAEGYSMMVGGDVEAVKTCTPIFETLAPAPDKGWGHVGPRGSGHYTKMVHNGIEYGMMQALAEGLALIRSREDFDVDLAELTEAWRHGSVVRSWLLDLTAGFLAKDQTLEDTAPVVPDSGEGRWTA